MPHELRFGELAELGLLPFSPYYGTHDATPLFMVVLSYAYEWSADKRLLRRYRPAAEAAPALDARVGRPRRRRLPGVRDTLDRGPFNQGWKDSGRGDPARGRSDPALPIALCELQAYAFDALLRMARIRDAFGDETRPTSCGPGAPGLRPVQRRLLVGERGDLLPRARRREAADPDRRLERRPLPRERDRPARPGRPGGRAADGSRHVDRLGDPDAVVASTPATTRSRTTSARSGRTTTRIDRRWVPALRAFDRGAARRRGDLRGRRAVRVAPAARAVRGPGTDPRELPGPVSRGQRAPGVGVRGRLPARGDAVRDPLGRQRRRTIYVNPDLPDWLPTITLRNLRAGNGAANLRMEHDRLEVLSNSTGFAIVQGPVPRPTPWSRDPVSR